jgi:hypothetical protein
MTNTAALDRAVREVLTVSTPKNIMKLWVDNPKEDVFFVLKARTCDMICARYRQIVKANEPVCHMPDPKARGSFCKAHGLFGIYRT